MLEYIGFYKNTHLKDDGAIDLKELYGRTALFGNQFLAIFAKRLR